MKSYDFNSRNEIVKETDCSRVFYVPGVTADEMRCKGDIIDIDGFGEKTIFCGADDCPLILGKLAAKAERMGY